MGRTRSVAPIVFFLLAFFRGLVSGQDYNGCETGGNRLCIGYPAGCLDQSSCEVLFKSSYDRLNRKLHAELFGTNTANARYVVIGLSLDTQMGDDSTTECARLPDGSVVLRNGFNTARPKLGNQLRDVSGIETVSSNATNGVLHCSWTRPEETSHDGMDWNLQEKTYYLLLASGTVKPDGSKGYHQHGKYAISPSAVALTATGRLESAEAGYLSHPLAKAHGMLMIIAWIGFASMGIIIARHCKNVLPEKTCMGVKMWFAFHRSCMGLTLVSALTAATLMFIRQGGWGGNRPHPIIGVISSSLLSIQIVGAMFRCGPVHEKRWIFNTAHWLLGNVTHIVSYAAIFTARVAVEAKYQSAFLSLLIVQVVCYAVTHVVLEVRTRLQNKRRTDVVQMNTMNSNQTKPEDEVTNSVDGKFRIVCVSIFAFANISITLLLCVIVGMSA